MEHEVQIPQFANRIRCMEIAKRNLEVANIPPNYNQPPTKGRSLQRKFKHKPQATQNASCTITSSDHSHRRRGRNSLNKQSAPTIAKSMAAERINSVTAPPRRSSTTAKLSALEARVSLVFALVSQTSSVSQRFLAELANETAKYVFPKRFKSRNLEEALMSVPDLETVKFKVLSRNDQYEIREVEPYFIAETTMPGKDGFDLNGASRSFNVLAEYLFGKNMSKEKMEMTTPVLTRQTRSDGEKMEMTTPVITKTLEDEDKWQMSFVIPSKYGSNVPLPKDSSVNIREVPGKIVAVVAFSGFVTDDEVKIRESKLRNILKSDIQYQVKEGASVEVAQYNPPFTLPFTRRNEIALEVIRKQE